MKKIYTLFLALIITGCLMAQAPQSFNYQAVVRGSGGSLIVNSQVGIKISILQGSISGTAVCIEEFSPTTNDYGLVTLEVGSVNSVDFELIDWSDGPYYIKIELDENGGTSYSEMGTSQLLSVPYALHANTASRTTGDSIWKKSTDDIYFNNGNVGIGTTSPKSRFEVSGITSNLDGIRLEGNPFNLRYMIQNTAGGEGERAFAITNYSGIPGLAIQSLDDDYGFLHDIAVFRHSGRVGIGTNNPAAMLSVKSNPLASTQGSSINWFQLTGNSGNVDNLYVFHNRHTEGTNWNSSEIRIQKQVDASLMHYISFKGMPSNNANMEFGFNNSPVMTFDKFGKVGIGTIAPTSKLQVEGSAAWSDEDPLFEVKNKDGIPVFAVFNNGVRILVEDDLAKGPKGGFSIGGFDRNKGYAETYDFMRITPDTIRFLINNDASKGPKGGFSIGGFDRNKGLVDDFMNLTSNSSLSGLYNTFLGYQVGLANTSTGNYNSSIGYQAGMSSTTADNNVFLGFQAGKYLTTGNSNVFLGTDAGGTSNGYDNVYIGRNAGRYESGFYNVYIGYGSGSREAPVPPFIPTNYSYNTAVGYMAGHNNTSQGLVAVGWHAGLQNSGDLNVFVGAECGQGNREGTRNTFLGMEAGWLNNSGSNNVFVGTEAGRDNNSGSGNIFIGNTAGATQNVDDRLFIDNSSITNPLIYGNFSSNVVRINGNLEYTGTLNHVSDLKLKTNLISIENVLSKIQGISGYYFDWNNEAKENLIVNDKKQIGVIAQELEVEFPELVSVNEEGYKTVDYANLTPILLQAIKEQQSEIEDLKEQMMQLQEMVGAMYGVWSKE